MGIDGYLPSSHFFFIFKHQTFLSVAKLCGLVDLDLVERLRASFDIACISKARPDAASLIEIYSRLSCFYLNFYHVLTLLFK